MHVDGYVNSCLSIAMLITSSFASVREEPVCMSVECTKPRWEGQDDRQASTSAAPPTILQLVHNGLNLNAQTNNPPWPTVLSAIDVDCSTAGRASRITIPPNQTGLWIHLFGEFCFWE
jgi:hypothetical protein